MPAETRENPLGTARPAPEPRKINTPARKGALAALLESRSIVAAAPKPNSAKAPCVAGSVTPVQPLEDLVAHAGLKSAGRVPSAATQPSPEKNQTKPGFSFVFNKSSRKANPVPNEKGQRKGDKGNEKVTGSREKIGTGSRGRTTSLVE
jgi:hypothetical protein